MNSITIMQNPNPNMTVYICGGWAFSRIPVRPPTNNPNARKQINTIKPHTHGVCISSKQDRYSSRKQFSDGMLLKSGRRSRSNFLL